MKLSTKLNKRISDSSVVMMDFSKKVQEAHELVKNFEELVAEGDKARDFGDKEIEKSLRKFNKVKNYCVNFAEEAADVTDELEEISNQIDTEAADVQAAADDTANTIDAASNTTTEEFARKFRILARRFSGISNELRDIVTEATSVVDMKPENVVKVDDNAITTKAEATTTSDGTPPEGVETTTQKTDVQTKAESVVNFSRTNYMKFAAKAILKSFAEIVDDVKESEKDAKDIASQVVEPEPEIKPAEGETQPAPTTTSAQEETVTPAPEETPPPESTPEATQTEESTLAEDEADKTAEEVLEFGEEAIMSGNDAVADELKTKLDDLEAKTPGKGEEVLSKLENFSDNFKKFRNFSTTVFDKIKEFTEGACAAAVKKDINAEDLGSKAENLEKNQPGAGELLTSVIECFGKIIDAIKVPNAVDDKKVAPEFHPENFCGNIDKFVNDINVADKKFARELKTKCFALENAIEDGNTDEIKKFCGDLANSLDKSDDSVVKAFGEDLVKFSEELQESTATETVNIPADSGVPENVAKADGELNQVLDKLSEKGEHLKPEVVSFAKKLCDAYKSIKCFTEEDLESKLDKIETLKTDLDAQTAPEATPTQEPAPASAPEVKPAETEVQTQLVEEEEKPTEELPSDFSIQNFSEVPKVEDDPLDHFASLCIR